MWKNLVLYPAKQIVFLGFLLCSETMTIWLTPERLNKILKCCLLMMTVSKCTIRTFAELIGKMVASEPSVEYAPLF